MGGGGVCRTPRTTPPTALMGGAPVPVSVPVVSIAAAPALNTPPPPPARSAASLALSRWKESGARALKEGADTSACREGSDGKWRPRGGVAPVVAAAGLRPPVDRGGGGDDSTTAEASARRSGVPGSLE